MASFPPRRDNPRDTTRISLKKSAPGRDLNIVVGDLRLDSPLLSPFPDDAGEANTRTPLGGLRASHRLVRLIGRDEALATAKSWKEDPPEQGPDERALVIHGAGGAGKTRLAAEILQKAKEKGWEAGFLSSRGTSHPSLSLTTHPEKPTMVAVDYAEARYTDLERLFEDAPSDREATAPFRVILIVRETLGQSGTWLGRLEGPEGNLGQRAERMLNEQVLTTISLEESLPSLEDRRTIWEEAFKKYVKEEEREKGDRPPELQGAPGYLSKDVFQSPLFVLLDAHRAFSGGAAGDPEAPSEEELIRSVLKHERKYWKRALEDLDLDLKARRLNQVAAIATLVGGIDRRAFRKALGALDWLREDEELLEATTRWWFSIYATSTGVVRGVEPDVVGEYLVTRALVRHDDPESPLDGSLRTGQLRSLIRWATPLGRQRILRVLTRIANSGEGEAVEDAKGVLAEVLDAHLDDFLPSTFSEVAGGDVGGGVGEPLATTVASAVLASNRLQLMVAQPAKAEGTADTAGTEIVSRTAVKAAAVDIVRRRIEQVATAKLETKQWSVDRFADVMAWVLRLDLDAEARGRAEETLNRVAALEPPPHRALAILRRNLARWLVSRSRLEEGISLLEQAQQDLAEAGESEVELNYVIVNDLGEAIEHTGASADARERYETALQGFRRLENPNQESVLNSLLNLAYSRGLEDLDQAFALLEEAEAEMADNGADEALLKQIKGGRPRALLAAARTAGRDGRLDDAKELLERGIEEVEENPEPFMVSILVEDLAEVEAARGEGERALSLLEDAFARKREMRKGVLHPGTIRTLENLAKALAQSGVDLAVERLGQLIAELDGDPRELSAVLNVQTMLLVHADRTAEAVALSQRAQEERVAQDARQAIFASAVERSVDPTVAVLPAIDACLLAARIFAVGDPRHLPLASRLARLTADRATLISGLRLQGPSGSILLKDERVSLILNRLSPAAAMADPESPEEATEASVATGVPASLLRLSSSAIEVFILITRRVREELDSCASDPYIAHLKNASDDEALKLADDPATRDWLLRASLWDPFPETTELVGNSLGAFFSWVVGLRIGEAQEPPAAADATDVWRHHPDPDLVAAEEERLLDDIQRFKEVDVEQARIMLALAKSNALRQSGTTAQNEGQLDEAEDLYKTAIEALDRVGQSESLPSRALIGRLARVASARGDTSRAIKLGEEALAGIRGLLGGVNDSSALRVVHQLVRDLAQDDPERARAVFERALADLDADGAPATEMHELRQVWLGSLRNAGHAALHEGDFDGAEVLYEEALEDLRARGEEDSALGCALIVDLGDVAVKRGDLLQALQLFEKGVEGRRRLHGGLAEANAIAAVIRLSSILAEIDPDQGEVVLDATLDELMRDGNEPNLVSHIRRERAGLRLSRARLAYRDHQYGLAEEVLLQGMGDLAQTKGDTALSAAIFTQELAGVAKARGDDARANQLHSEAMAIIRAHLGGAEAKTGMATMALALALARTDLEEAEEVFDTAVATLRDADDEGSARAMEDLRNGRALIVREAACAALAISEPDKARTLFERALEELEREGERDSILGDSILHELAVAAEALGERERAVQLLDECLAGKSARLGPLARDTIITAAGLASTLAETDFDRALAALETATQQAEAAGAAASDLFPLQKARANVMHVAARSAHKKGRFDEASSLYQRAIEEIYAIEGADSPFRAMVLWDLAEVVLSEDEVETAVALLEEGLEIVRRRFGETHPSALEGHQRVARALGSRDVEEGLARLERSMVELSAREDAETAVAALRRAKADVLLRAGRKAEAEEDLDSAEELYLRALREGGEEGDNAILAHVLTHDLGDVAVGKKDLKRAIELYETAFEGKRRVHGGLGDPDTISTLLRLAEALSDSNVDAGLSLLDDALPELEVEEAPATSIAEVRRGRATLLREKAYRILHEEGELSIVEESLQAAFDELRDIGDEETAAGYALVQDLGELWLAQGKREAGREALQRALQGKRRIHGPADPNTLAALNLLAQDLATTDPDAAVTIFDETVEDLVESGAGGDTVDRVKLAVPLLLLDTGRIDEQNGETEQAEQRFEEARARAAAVEGGRALAAVATHDLGDIARLRGDSRQAAALYERALKEKIATKGDQDLDTIASLATLIEVQADFEPRAALGRVESELEHPGLPDPDGIKRLRLARINVLHAVGHLEGSGGNLDEAERLYREALQEVEGGAQEVPGLEATFHHELGDVAGQRGEFEAAVEHYRRALKQEWELVGAADAMAAVTASHLVACLTQVDPAAAVATAEETLAKLLAAEAGDEELARIRRERVAALMFAGREHERAEELEQAEDLYRNALDALAAMGESGSVLHYALLHDLGDIAWAKGSRAEAISLFEESLAGTKANLGLLHVETLALLTQLGEALATDGDFGRVSALIGEATTELKAEEDTPEAIEALAAARTRILLVTGRSVAADDPKEAERHYSGALEELDKIKDDWVLRYVLLHDLANLAVADEELDRAAELYEQSLEGKKRLLGIAEWDTVTTLLSLATVLAKENREEAFSRLEEAIEELGEVAGGEGAIVRIRSWMEEIDGG